MMTKKKGSAEKAIGDIRRATRRRYSAEEKIRTVLALEKPELSGLELAVRYTEKNGYFVSESSVYRLLKAHDRKPDESKLPLQSGGLEPETP
jgi:hypothetical protein